jgi:hypothetical protein
MKKRDEHFLPVGALLRGALESHPAFSANPLGDWSQLAGDMVGRHSQPISLKKKVLKVVAYDSVWMHHLELNKEPLIEKINRGRPEPLVEKIVIQVGEVPEALAALNPNQRLLEKIDTNRSRPKRRKKPTLRKLTSEEKALIKSLPDPDLRAVSERLLRLLPLSPQTE